MFFIILVIAVTINKRITSGEDIKDTEFLFLICLIYNNSSILYRGNLVDSTIVITAGYCVTLNAAISVRAGSLVNYTLLCKGYKVI